MGAEYLFYMKSIETHARAFLGLIILGIGTVNTTSRKVFLIMATLLMSRLEIGRFCIF